MGVQKGKEKFLTWAKSQHSQQKLFTATDKPAKRQNDKMELAEQGPKTLWQVYRGRLLCAQSIQGNKKELPAGIR